MNVPPSSRAGWITACARATRSWTSCFGRRGNPPAASRCSSVAIVRIKAEADLAEREADGRDRLRQDGGQSPCLTFVLGHIDVISEAKADAAASGVEVAGVDVALEPVGQAGATADEARAVTGAVDRAVPGERTVGGGHERGVTVDGHCAEVVAV